jgi:threonylcarbamoyladenosine tRNA methylthiotransferase CDKAL1
LADIRRLPNSSRVRPKTELTPYTDDQPAMRAYIEAYGCTLNFGEARELEEMLAGLGWDIVSDPSACDLAVLVTCVVIETTEKAMMRRVQELSSAPKLIITGCMATACRAKAERAAPAALFVAPGDFDSFRDAVGDQVDSARMLEDKSACAIVPIASGCRGSCAYCITRIARGQLRSRLPERVRSSVAKAVERGRMEIQLTAQDTAAYGADVGTDLPSLVGEICGLEHDFRLRVGMMNPSSALPLLDRLCEMYQRPKVFKFLHLPVQSGEDGVLERMGRGYTVDDFMRIVRRVRDAAPLLTLSTDLIVGYPGEGEDAHRRNKDLVRSAQPDIVNVTRFSPRPGTRAAAEGPKVPGWKAKERSRELTALRFEVSLRRNESWVGRECLALATERGKAESTIFRTDEYKQVVVPERLRLGAYSLLRVTEARPTYLMGEVSHG